MISTSKNDFGPRLLFGTDFRWGFGHFWPRKVILIDGIFENSRKFLGIKGCRNSNTPYLQNLLNSWRNSWVWFFDVFGKKWASKCVDNPQLYQILALKVIFRGEIFLNTLSQSDQDFGRQNLTHQF